MREREYRIPGADCELYVQVRGEGKALLLIHGVACDSSFFDAVADLLAGDYRVIRYDRRGYRRSRAKEDADFSVSAQAGDVLRILDSLGVERVCAAGCSAGGLIALELAQLAPDRVESLFLHEPPLGYGHEWETALAECDRTLREVSGRGSMARAMLTFAKMTGGPDPDGEKTDFSQLARNMESLRIFLNYEREDFLHYHERLSVPLPLPKVSALAAGSEDGKGLFSRFAPEAAAWLRIPFLRVPGWHNLAQERPALFARILADFIENNRNTH